jgi:hypothetical protein
MTRTRVFDSAWVVSGWTVVSVGIGGPPPCGRVVGKASAGLLV